MECEPGAVYLVGAGPGDPGLLTLRARDLLSRADVVVHDALVHPDLLRLAPRTAEILYAGKRSRDHAIPQENLNRLLVERARKGQTVVRLKGGDPYIFGRGGEEAEELHSAGVPFEVVPGISSVVAAANYAGIPLTHRDHCSGFSVITGHEDPDKPLSMLDWEHFAGMPGTKAVLMGMERLDAIAAQLRKCGMDPATPAGVIRWGTTSRQRVVVGTLGDIAAKVETAGLGAPALVVLGTVVELRERLDWFGRRPLLSRRIVVTRTRTQASGLARRLTGLGADVLEIPVIRIVPPSRPAILTEVLESLGEYDWLVFTSPNGVDAFFDAFRSVHDDIRALGLLRIATVGPATAERIRVLRLRIDAMPERHVAAAVADAVRDVEPVENLRILLPRAEVASPELPARFHELGAIVDDVPVYRTEIEREDAGGAAARFAEEGADWVTFTSSSTVENFHRRFDLDTIRERFPRIRWASIGPETSRTLRESGHEPHAEAREHNIPGLVQALLESR